MGFLMYLLALWSPMVNQGNSVLICLPKPPRRGSWTIPMRKDRTMGSRFFCSMCLTWNSSQQEKKTPYAETRLPLRQMLKLTPGVVRVVGLHSAAGSEAGDTAEQIPDSFHRLRSPLLFSNASRAQGFQWINIRKHQYHLELQWLKCTTMYILLSIWSVTALRYRHSGTSAPRGFSPLETHKWKFWVGIALHSSARWRKAVGGVQSSCDYNLYVQLICKEHELCYYLLAINYVLNWWLTFK